MGSRYHPVGEQGFVLPLTLIIMLLLTLFAVGVSKVSRLHLDDVAIRKQNLIDEIKLRNALQRVIYHLLTGQAGKNLLASRKIRFYLDGTRFKMGDVTASVQDVAGLLGLGFFNGDALFQVLRRLTDQKRARRLSARIGDWIDKNVIARPSGMESVDYIKQGVPWLPRNAPLRSLDELLAVPGVTPALFNGHDGIPGLRDLLQAGGIGYVNWATVPPLLLASLLDVSSAEAQQLVAMRQQGEWGALMAVVNARSLLHRMKLMVPSNRYLIRLSLPSGSRLRVLWQKKPRQKVPYRYLLWQYPDHDRG